MDQSLLRKARRRLLRMHFESNVGHIGGNLSCLDILMTLYHDVMQPEDQFILSKGHAAGALYVTLWSKGILTDEDLQTFHKDGTNLPGHTPINRFGDIIFGTGSLGHGISLGCGLALAKKLQGKEGRIFVLTSDGEWNEGSCWEALMFAVRHRLDNLIIIVDNNGLQGMGSTKEISGLDTELNQLIKRFICFGAYAWDLDIRDLDGGYNCTLFYKDHSPLKRPSIISFKTIKGQGVSFMENDFSWHYKPLSAEQYEQALAENPE